MDEPYNRRVNYGKVLDDWSFDHTPNQNDPKYRRSLFEIAMEDTTGQQKVAVLFNAIALGVLIYQIWKRRR